jgi:hypothetical protein
MAEISTQKFARTDRNTSENQFPHQRKILAKNRSVNYDELISTLAQSHENRRAMQAFEWEAVRRGHDVRIQH